MSGAHIAIHAAAEQRRRKQEEEEIMVRYNDSELNGEWEFKIVRSASSGFRRPEVFRQLIEEEAVSGWELLEKLDDGRVRFKRPVSARRRDGMLPPGIDPYRSQHGISEGAIAFWIVSGVLLAMGAVIGVIAMTEAGVIF